MRGRSRRTAIAGTTGTPRRRLCYHQAMRAPLLVGCTLGGCLLGLAPGCERFLSIQDPVAGDGSGSDGGIADVGGDDGGLPASSPILLSEIVLAPTEAEMIEIVNTSSQDVDLSTYYLSDSGDHYYKLPVGPSVDLNDFIAKFPDGAVIPGHGVVTVAVDTPQMFASVYKMSPTYSLADDTMKIIAANAPTLTNGGESVILFQWDGHSDLVRDVDIMIVGAPSAGNLLTPKSGVAQDGPDPDTLPSTYATDANTIMPQAAAPMPITTPPPIQVFSTQRILLEDGHEMQGVGGNGQSGDDETSEDTSVTWDGTSTHPFGLATPGQVPLALLR
jgi:hypothetical protein